MKAYRTSLVIFFIVAGLARLNASTYYVATENPNASDSNPGTQAQPWKTMQHSVNMVQPGDTVMIGAGVYNESLTITTSGTASLPIVFEANPGDLVTVDGTGVSGNYLVNMSQGVDYVTLEGIEIRNGVAWGIWLKGNHDVITKCTVHDNGANTTYSAEGIFVESGDYNEITHNVVYNNRWNGIGVQDANHTVVAYNIVHNNVNHNGINIMPDPSAAYYGMMDDNNVYDNIVYANETGIYMRYQENNEIVNNLIYNNQLEGIFFHVGGTGGPTSYAAYTKVYNNTIAENGMEGLASNGANDLTIENNVFYMNRQDGVAQCEVAFDNTLSGHVIDYNIYVPTTQYYFEWGGTRIPWSSVQSLGFESHGLSSGVVFVAPNNGDFHLQSGSAGIDAGVDLSALGVVSDLDGIARPQGKGFDMGAYESAAVARPNPPSNLRIALQ